MDDDVLCYVQDQQLRPFAVTPELEAWLLEAAGKPATPLAEANFRGIRQRAHARIRPPAA